MGGSTGILSIIDQTTRRQIPVGRNSLESKAVIFTNITQTLASIVHPHQLN